MESPHVVLFCVMGNKGSQRITQVEVARQQDVTITQHKASTPAGGFLDTGDYYWLTLLSVWVGDLAVRFWANIPPSQRQLHAGFYQESLRESLRLWQETKDKLSYSDKINTYRLICTEYEITRERARCLRDYIQNAVFYVIVPDEYCYRPGESKIVSVHWAVIEKTDTRMVKACGAAWQKLSVDSKSTKVNCGFIGQTFWDALNTYVATGELMKGYKGYSNLQN